MKALIKKMLFESLIRSEESLELMPINDISDDDLYDSLVIQSQNIKNQENISFNGSLYSVIFNPKNGKLVGACWLEDNAKLLSPHFIILQDYRKKGLFGRMLLDTIGKYKSLSKYRNNYQMIVNAINPDIVSTLLKNGFKKYKDQSYIYND